MDDQVAQVIDLDQMHIVELLECFEAEEVHPVDISVEQCKDPHLKAISDYLKDGILPKEDAESCQIIDQAYWYDLVDGILYYSKRNKS